MSRPMTLVEVPRPARRRRSAALEVAELRATIERQVEEIAALRQQIAELGRGVGRIVEEFDRRTWADWRPSAGEPSAAAPPTDDAGTRVRRTDRFRGERE